MPLKALGVHRSLKLQKEAVNQASVALLSSHLQLGLGHPVELPVECAV